MILVWRKVHLIPILDLSLTVDLVRVVDLVPHIHYNNDSIEGQDDEKEEEEEHVLRHLIRMMKLKGYKEDKYCYLVFSLFLELASRLTLLRTIDAPPIWAIAILRLFFQLGFELVQESLYQ